MTLRFGIFGGRVIHCEPFLVGTQVQILSLEFQRTVGIAQDKGPLHCKQHLQERLERDGGHRPLPLTGLHDIARPDVICGGSCWIPGSCIRQWRTPRFLSFSPPCRPSFSRAVTMRSASRTLGEHKTPESNKSDLYNTTGDLAVQPEEVESSVHGIALLSLSAGGYTGRPCVRHGHGLTLYSIAMSYSIVRSRRVTMTHHVTQQLAEFVASTSLSHMPDEVIDRAKYFVLDYLG